MFSKDNDRRKTFVESRDRQQCLSISDLTCTNVKERQAVFDECSSTWCVSWKVLSRMNARWNETNGRSIVSNTKKGSVRDEKRRARTDLYQAIFPIYYPSKFFGILPVKFTKETTGRYRGRLCVLDIIYSICLLTILLGAGFWGLWRDLRDGWERSTRLKSRTAIIATCSDIFGVMSLTSVSILGSSFRWKYMQFVFEKLIEIDEKLGITSPKKTRRFTVLLACCNLAYLLIISTLDIYAWNLETKATKKMNDKGPINYSPLYLMYVVIILMEIQYGVSTYNVGQRFARLNGTLESILRISNNRITDYFRKDLGLASDLRDQTATIATIASVAGGLNQSQDPATVRVFRKMQIQTPTGTNGKKTCSITELVTIHSALCDTVSYMNNAFGVAILTVMLTCLMHLIITPYFLILEFDGKRDWIFLVVQVLWCIFHVTRMLIIVQPTYATVTEGKKTAILVSQLLSSNPQTESRRELEIFSLQILHRPLEFSACGLFSLDRALVTSIAGAVTTYLVILIQFQTADDTKGDADVIRNVSQILKNASSFQNFTALKFTS